MSNLNKIDAINAVTEAWTLYGSSKFINYVLDLQPGAVWSLNVTAPWDALVYVSGAPAASSGIVLQKWVNNTYTGKNIGTSPSNIGFGRTGNTFTYTNNGANPVDIFIISFRGVAEEV